MSDAETLPKILVDWNDMWGKDLVGLDVVGAHESFARQGITKQAGLKIRLIGDEYQSDAVVIEYEYKPTGAKFLVAKIVEGTFVHVPPDSTTE